MGKNSIHRARNPYSFPAKETSKMKPVRSTVHMLCALSLAVLDPLFLAVGAQPATHAELAKPLPCLASVRRLSAISNKHSIHKK